MKSENPTVFRFMQIQQNEKLRHLEGQLELTDKLHTELQSAQVNDTDLVFFNFASNIAINI